MLSLPRCSLDTHARRSLRQYMDLRSANIYRLDDTSMVDERKTNLMSLAILFHLLCAQHVSDINISIFRSLRLCWWITTSVVLFSVRFVLEFLLRLVFGGVRFAGWSFSLQNEHHQISAAPNLQHTTNWEQDDRCGNSSTQSQAPEDGYINVRNMLSA